MSENSAMRLSAMLRRLLCLALFFGVSAPILVAAPEWVDTYGTRTPYPSALYYTGFGVASRAGNDAQAIDLAKAQAKADLITKIQVQVTSRIVSEERQAGSRLSVEAASMSESVAVLDIDNVEYDLERTLRHFYVLARVSKESLAAKYRDEFDAALHRVGELRSLARRHEASGDHAAALRVYAPLSTALQDSFRLLGILETVSRDLLFAADPFPASLGGERVSKAAYHALGPEIDEALDRLKFGVSRNLDAAMDLMIVQLADQEVPRGAYRVANLVYQDSGHSSAFGAFAAQAVAGRLASGYRGEASDGVVRGSYWVDGDEIVIRLIFQTVSGSILGSSRLALPVGSVDPSIELAPRNAEQALADRFDIAQGAVVDGGISVEVWTHMGRDTDRLVFSRGDIITFYFRVNQPCHLQLAYLLATGERVLLAESFYIGIDRVNMAVRYPVEFMAVPPFGVERLIVTAYEVQPPKPKVVVKRIAGHDYQVFDSIDSVYASTRGMIPVVPADAGRNARIGEVSLTLTTVEKVPSESR